MKGGQEMEEREQLLADLVELLQYADERALKIIKAFVFPMVQENIIENEK